MQKKWLKSANIWQTYSKNKSGPVFFDSQCIKRHITFAGFGVAYTSYAKIANG